MVQFLGFWQIHSYISTFTVWHKVVSLPYTPSVLHLLSPPSTLTSDNYWYFHCPHSFVFSSISYSWNHTRDSLFRLVYFHWASLVAQRLKRLPLIRETWVRSLGWEDPLEKEMATHSSILAWRIPWTENLMDGEAWWATVHGAAKSRTWLRDLT